MNIDILLGKTTEHLVPLEGTKHFLHKDTLRDFLRLKQAAKENGLDLEIISSFRDHARQLKIWNAKVTGERPIYDDQGNKLDPKELSPTELMFAILRWSALPGASRHHWGTDIDVYDARKQKAEEVQLIPSECEGDGPASKLHAWLDLQIDQKNSFHFFRPYSTDRQGVAPERWHLSYSPVSRRIMAEYPYTLFKRNIEESDLLLKDVLLENASEIFERFFLNVDLP